MASTSPFDRLVSAGWRTPEHLGGEEMPVTQGTARSISAPEVLGLDTRIGFREAAIHELDGMPDGGALAVDLRRTARVDSAGLTALMLIQRHAAARHQRVVLRDASDEFKFLLALTRMSDLFELEPPRPQVSP